MNTFKYWAFETINNVGRTLLLGLPRKQNLRPIGYITLLSNISPLKCGIQRLWRIIYVLLAMAMLDGPLIDVKDLGKVRNRRVAKLQIVLVIIIIIIIILVKKFIPWQLIHGCRYCSLNNTNELRLLVSSAFWVKKKEATEDQISSKKHCIRARTSLFVSSPQPLHDRDEWIASFYIALFKLRT